MESKSLLFGIIGFIAGGLLVSIVATTIDKPVSQNADVDSVSTSQMDMSMTDMSMQLRGKTGDDFDKAFLSGMIIHHEGAIAMAQQAKSSAKHDEIKTLATDIIAAQNTEITKMKQWQKNWNYTTDSMMMHQ